MKKITCLLAALLLTCGLSWAQQITWSAADQGYDNGQVIESVDFNDYVSAEFFKGTNNNEPKYYNTGTAIRCYGGNYFTITSDYVLTEIVLGFGSGDGSNTITTDCGTYENGTWTGNANEVTFTIGGTTGHRRFATFTITYDEGGSPAPSISADNVEIAYDATEGAIEYTINNGVEGGVLTAATEAEWLTIGTVGETVPFTCSVNENGQRVATVTLTYTYNTDQTVTKNVTVTQITNPDIPGTQNNPYTVAQARAAIDAGVGTQGVYATGIVSAIPTAYNSQYQNVTFNMVDEEGDEDFLQAYRCGGDEAANVAVGDVVVVYGNLTFHNASSTYEFAQGCQVVSLTHPAVPSVTVTPAILDVDADEHEGTLEITYANIPEFISFDMYFCDVNGDALEEDPDWILAEIQEENDTYSVYYVIDANDGDARTAYFKVYTFVGEVDEVYAIVTVNQAAYVAPVQDYATLPFAFDGGRADIETTDGLTQNGLGSDYSSSPKLKFDTTDDWMILHFNEEPGQFSFVIRGTGNPFSGTFTVETSVDGVDYETLATYTELGDAETMTFDALDADVRYIRWYFTEKVSGCNVGIGNIHLYPVGGGPAFITVEPDILNVDAEQHLVNYFSLTYENIVADSTQCFTVHYYNAEGQEIEPVPGEAWMIAGVVKLMDIYQVLCTIIANEGEARSGYFKVSAQDANDNTVYSNLVTINQAGVAQQYTLTVEPFENLELITFVNDEMVMEGDGTINAVEGDAIMLSIVADEGYVMETLMVNGVNHVNDIAADFTYSFEMPAENVTISATAVEDIPFEGATYSLATYIEPGRHYIITNGTDKAMGQQNNNNRAAVDVNIEEGVAEVESADVYEFVINGPDINGFYTIYDANEASTGYLYAASNSSNWLRTREFNIDANSLWSIEFNDSTNVATIIAQGDNSRNWMRYNNSGLFSCYGETNSQHDIYLFVKDDDTYEFYMDIKGYTEGQNDTWYAISTPVNTNPTNVNHMLDETFDLYKFDPTVIGEEWQNYRINNFTLTPGEGYLYANENNVTLRFAGEVGDLYAGDGTVALPYYDEENEDLCWNLVGNPFGFAANTLTSDFYVMKEDGSDFELAEREMLKPFEAIFVKAEFEGDEIFFYNDDVTGGGMGGGNFGGEKLNVRVSDENGKGDFARVRFGEGNNLEKFMLNPANTKLYFPMDDEDYAVVYADNMGEMPLNFNAAADGDYTLNINVKNMEMEYLHLIDNMTGTDVDLLATPSYSFHARMNDNAARFTLVFASLTGMDENTADQFAFFSNGSFIVSNEGNAMLQVVDVTGRIVKSESINGTASVSVDAAPGVYMLRLVTGDNVKVQKVVVK